MGYYTKIKKAFKATVSAVKSAFGGGGSSASSSKSASDYQSIQPKAITSSAGSPSNPASYGINAAVAGPQKTTSALKSDKSSGGGSGSSGGGSSGGGGSISSPSSSPNFASPLSQILPTDLSGGLATPGGKGLSFKEKLNAAFENKTEVNYDTQMMMPGGGLNAKQALKIIKENKPYLLSRYLTEGALKAEAKCAKKFRSSCTRQF